MFKILAFLSRKEGVSRAAFMAYYEQNHVRLIGEVAPPMRAYRRNFLDFADPGSRRADLLDFDVVTELEFADRAESEAWFAAFASPGALERVVEDEEKFLDRGRTRLCVVDVTGG